MIIISLIDEFFFYYFFVNTRNHFTTDYLTVTPCIWSLNIILKSIATRTKHHNNNNNSGVIFLDCVIQPIKYLRQYSLKALYLK